MWAFSSVFLLAVQAAATPQTSAPPARTTPAVTARAAAQPAQSVPDQPFTGTPKPGAKPYEAILQAKEAGASNAALLAKVRREKVVYSLTTYDIQKLRGAGVSADVIEAMMHSGRAKTTPAPALPKASTPTGATPPPTPR